MPRTSKGTRLFQRAGVYYVIEFNGHGKPKRVSTGTRSRPEAETFLAGYLLKSGAKALPSPSVATILEQYWSAHRKTLASPETARQGIDRLEDFFQCQVSELTPARLRAYYEGGRPVAATTKARELTVLRAALNYALAEEWLESVPKVPVTPPLPPKERWLTRQEAARLLYAARGERRRHLALFIRLALYTGARSAAILGLKWAQVDLKRGRIDYNPPGRRPTQKKRPVVAIGPRLSAALQRVRRVTTGPFVIEYGGEGLERIKGAFRRAAQDAKLEDVTPHTLRHTAATWMAQAGLPLPMIAGVLGQSITRTTERYIKHSPDYQAGAAEALERGKVSGRNERDR